jgi:glycerol-3-phosphate dehydrogenase
MLKRRPEIIDHQRDGVAGVMTLIGVKYTTARGVAERAIDAAVRKLGTGRRASRTAAEVLPGASIADHEALAIETEQRLRVSLADRTRDRLVSLYGARCVPVIELAASDPSLAEPLDADSAAIGAEIVYAIRQEAARRLDDILMRRTGLGAAQWPGDRVVERASEIAARELQWKGGVTKDEVDRLRRSYDIP